MLKFKLYRKENTSDFCRGRLYVNIPDDDYSEAADSNLSDFAVCDTLEPPVRPASRFIRGKTAVPAGTYDVALTRSPKFGRLLPILIDVPGMTGIRIHRGNTVADTRGCILPGRYVGEGRLADSTPREMDIVNMLARDGEMAVIEVINDFDGAQVEEDRSPCLATSPLLKLVPQVVWDKLRLGMAI